MKAVLLSIKPEFAHKIFDGTKKYEFRKKVFKDENIRKVIVYASSPEKKVLGEFDIDRILTGTPNEIWQQTKDVSGITHDFYKIVAEKYAGKLIKIFDEFSEQKETSFSYMQQRLIRFRPPIHISVQDGRM